MLDGEVQTTALLAPADRVEGQLAVRDADRPIRILLVHPQHAIQRFGTGVYKKHLRYAPITMPTLAALIPPDVRAEVRVIDEMVEELDLSLDADLVGLTAISSASTRPTKSPPTSRPRGRRLCSAVCTRR